MSAPYEEDLAFVQAAAFGDFATGAVPAILERLRAAPIAIRHVIDVGCGAGITTRALLDVGYEVTAIERSRPLLEISRANAPGARFVNASAYDAELPRCEAILAIGEPLTYHSPDAAAEGALQGFFRKAAAALAPGGLLIFDVIVTGSPSLDGRGYRTARDWALLYETTEDDTAPRLTRTIETFRRDGEHYRRATEIHHVRIFAENGVRAWLEGVRFDVEVARQYGAMPLLARRVAFFASLR